MSTTSPVELSPDRAAFLAEVSALVARNDYGQARDKLVADVDRASDVSGPWYSAALALVLDDMAGIARGAGGTFLKGDVTLVRFAWLPFAEHSAIVAYCARTRTIVFLAQDDLTHLVIL